MDNVRAGKILIRALSDSQDFSPMKLDEAARDAIRDIIEGPHLTFRYILITALLAKVTDPLVHMRSLQSQSSLPGSYDARSLCHKVWVPFEREHMQSRLGGSNEPFLNKPARFPEIDKTNAVRAGSDSALLYRLYDLLERLNSSSKDVHFEALVYALSVTTGRTAAFSEQCTLPSLQYSQAITSARFNGYLGQCCGGEVAASAIGAIARVLGGNDRTVKVHPANQAGTSSKEVGDIDIIKKNKIICSIEAKDKSYTISDIEHAARKVAQAGGTRLLFVIGRHANQRPPVAEHERLSALKAKSGVDVSFIKLDDLMATAVAISDEAQRSSMLIEIAKILDEMRANDKTKKHFEDTILKST